MRNLTLLSTAAFLTLTLSMALCTRVGADGTTVDDLIFVTDDDAAGAPACDSLVVVDANTGRHVDDGTKYISPGRIAVSPGAKWITSVSNNNASEPFLVLKQPLSTTLLRWSDSQILGDVIEASETAFSPDGKYLLVTRPGRITKHLVSEFSGRGIGPVDGELRTGVVTNIVFFSDSRRAALVTADGTVSIIDVATMIATGLSATYPPSSNDGRLALRRTFAAISPDDRYLLIATGTRVVTLIDLDNMRSSAQTLSGQNSTFGIAFNYRSAGRIFAAHGRNSIGVFRLRDEGIIELATSIGVPPQDPQYSVGNGFQMRPYSLAWTGRGDGLVVAIGGLREFRVLNFVSSGSEFDLTRRLDFEGCTEPGERQMALDVATLHESTRPTITAIPLPTPSATPLSTVVTTVTPLPMPTNAPTPTSSPTPTSQPSSTPSPTPPPSPIYLPVALNEHCTPTQRRTDAVLVIDASTSMLDRDASGAVKLDAAINAARAFIALLDLRDPSAPVDPRDPGDQAALIAFNADAQLLQPLTADPSALASSFARIVPASQTCLVCAVDAAAAELASPRHRDGNVPVVVLLTDGRANPRPASEAVDAAARAKAAGVTFFTIALGDDVDDGALEAIAAPGGRYYRAVTADGLAEVYRQVAGRIPCPAGGFWGRR